jgi:hypothetical protein
MIAGHVAGTREEKKVYSVLVVKPEEKTEERNHSEDQGVYGRIGTELILGRMDGEWNGFSWFRTYTGGGLL